MAVGRNDVKGLEELITTYGKEFLLSTEGTRHNPLLTSTNYKNNGVLQVMLQNGMNPNVVEITVAYDGRVNRNDLLAVVLRRIWPKRASTSSNRDRHVPPTSGSQPPI